MLENKLSNSEILLLWRAVLTPDLGSQKLLNLDSRNTPVHEGIYKGWRPPKAAATLCGGAASFMDGRVVTV